MRRIFFSANTLLPILLLSTFKLAGASSKDVDNSVAANIQKLEQINQTIHEVITSAGHNPHVEILTRYFPEDAKFINDHPERVEKCYNSTVNGKTTSIFEASIGSVVHEYLHRSLLKHDKVTHDSISDRVTALLENMRKLGHLIIECVKGQGQGRKPTKLGLTKFAEMSAEEIRSTYQQPLEEENDEEEEEKEMKPIHNSSKVALGRQRGQRVNEFVIENSHFYVDKKSYPEAFDYRNQGVVGPVKDQGTCGLCFLFGIMGAIESSYMLKHGQQNVSFSEKDLVDCMVEHGHYSGTAKLVLNKEVQLNQTTGEPIIVPSCRPGGQQKKALIEAMHSGLTLASQGDAFVRDRVLGQGFPFKPNRCGKDPVVTKVSGWATQKNIPHNEDFLKGVLMKYGPVSTVFRTELLVDGHSNSSAFFFIKEKMHLECDASTSVNHVMSIIGWEKDYWIIRNSYGNHKPEEHSDKVIDQPWGVEGVLYLEKRLATGCGLFGPGSKWYFPQVE